MAGPETAGFALVTRSELELAHKLTAGQLSEETTLAGIEDVATVELPVCLIGDEAQTVKMAVEGFLRKVPISSYEDNVLAMNAGRRILFRALDSASELQAAG